MYAFYLLQNSKKGNVKKWFTVYTTKNQILGPLKIIELLQGNIGNRIIMSGALRKAVLCNNYKIKLLLASVRCFSVSTSDAPATTQTVQDVKTQLIKLMGVQRGYQMIPKSRQHLLQYLPKSQNDLPKRVMKESFDSAVIPLSKSVDLQEKYITSLGHIRLGRLMEDMDIFAVWCAMKHIHGVGTEPISTITPYNIVTVLVDQIDFTDYTPKPDADVRLSGHVCWVGKSSIEVVVWLEQEAHGSWQKITRSLFLMAARNSTNTGSAPVNALEAENDEEKEILLGGEERKRRRQQVLSRSLLKTIPDETEQQLIHDLFIRTSDPQDPTLHRRILPPHAIWMKQAQLSNHIFCHPEDRNLHNKVFGGFLMRHALELAFTAAYLHSKHRSKLLHISDIGFHKPVDVGSILKMHSHVTYTERNYMQIVVYADVYDPHTGLVNTTNMFHYTFRSPEHVVSVIPKSYHEAMMYVDARRHFQHVMNVSPDKH